MFDFLFFDLSYIFSWEFVSHGWPQFVTAWEWSWGILIWLTSVLWNISSGLSSWIISGSGWGLHEMWYAESGLFAVPFLGFGLTIVFSFLIFIFAAAALFTILILFIGFVALIWMVGGGCILVLWSTAWFLWYVCWTIIVWLIAPMWNLVVLCLMITFTIIFWLALIVIIFILPGVAAGQVLYYLDDYESRWRYGLSLISWGLLASALVLLWAYTGNPWICVWYFALTLAVHVGFRYKKLPLPHTTN